MGYPCTYPASSPTYQNQNQCSPLDLTLSRSAPDRGDLENLNISKQLAPGASPIKPDATMELHINYEPETSGEVLASMTAEEYAAFQANSDRGDLPEGFEANEVYDPEEYLEASPFDDESLPTVAESLNKALLEAEFSKPVETKKTRKPKGGKKI